MAEFISETVILHEGRYIPAVAGNTDYAELIASGVNIVPWQEYTPTPEKILETERAAMKPYRLSFFLAMANTSAVGYSNLYIKVKSLIETERALNPAALIVIWFDGVGQILRNHNNMEDFKTLTGITDTQLDDLCRLAIQIETGT